MFRAIKSYEGFYEVNESGRVRSVDRVIKCKGKSTRKCKGKELKLQMDQAGYTMVYLHQLVGRTLRQRAGSTGVHRID